jgi:hypothetical protein
VAVVALAFTAYSFFRQHGLQQRLAAIEEDRRREEVASSLQAEVGARFESYLSDTSPAHENYQLVLSNAGQARAEEVTVELVGPIEGNAPDLVMRGTRSRSRWIPARNTRLPMWWPWGRRPRSTYCSGGRTGPAPARRRST